MSDANFWKHNLTILKENYLQKQWRSLLTTCFLNPKSQKKFISEFCFTNGIFVLSSQLLKITGKKKNYLKMFKVLHNIFKFTPKIF